jgi:hypothetical protein
MLNFIVDLFDDLPSQNNCSGSSGKKLKYDLIIIPGLKYSYSKLLTILMHVVLAVAYLIDIYVTHVLYII